MFCTKCDERDLIMDAGKFICTECGLVHGGSHFIIGINTYNDPLQICYYQRKKRFSKILDKIVRPNLDNKDTPVYKHLVGKTFDTIEELQTYIKTLNIKDKRYHSLHAFCKLCLKNYTPPKTFTLQEEKRCLFLFELVEMAFLKHTNGVPFFNYAWLIRKVLFHFGFSQFELYVKKIKCPKRNIYYETMFTNLYKAIQVRGDVGNCP